MKDPLKQFTHLRESLLKRQAEVQAELIQIAAALGTPAPASTPAPVAAPEVSAEPQAPAKTPGRRGPGKRASNELSLAEAVLTVTKDKPLPKQQILDAVIKLGYQFSAKDPLNSLNTTLYTNKKIKNFGGSFGPKWIIRPSSPTAS
ncbi:MAG: hypothetical protein KIT22_10510 [Verrucomicrobiae bacterium]|nr:hypothetical protein [Verrucomicrobiae bacterium]